MSDSGTSHTHEHGSDHDAGLSHVLPWELLVAVLAVLMILTWLTVAVRNVDLGGLNLTVAMIIATVKVVLVMSIFMHLRWDNRFHVVLFLMSFGFAALFISLTLLDKSEYQQSIVEMEQRRAQGR